MKVLMVSTTDRLGGAAIGAYRIHRALRNAGIQCEMLVLRKVTADPSVHRLADHLERWGRGRRRLAESRHHRRLASHARRAEAGHWSLNQFSYPIAEVINGFAADIAHLQWAGDNFLPISELAKIDAPLVWTLQDMWPLTGGCHYAGDCQRYRETCGRCPQLVSGAERDLSTRVMHAKREKWARKPMTIVCLSRWLARCARESALMRDRRIEVIGNPIDPQVFKPLDQTAARRAFNLPLGRKLILFGAIGGASDRRKGFQYLHQALRGLSAESDAELVIFGGDNPGELQQNLPTHHIGQLRDELSLSLLYSACDVYVLPTLEEAFGNTLAEALASGSPCVTFDSSGAVDIVRHRRDGYIARLLDSDDLLSGIEWTLAQSWSPARLHEDLIARYGAAVVARRYITLYQSLLDCPA